MPDPRSELRTAAAEALQWLLWLRQGDCLRDLIEPRALDKGRRWLRHAIWELEEALEDRDNG